MRQVVVPRRASCLTRYRVNERWRVAHVLRAGDLLVFFEDSTGTLFGRMRGATLTRVTPYHRIARYRFHNVVNRCVDDAVIRTTKLLREYHRVPSWAMWSTRRRAFNLTRQNDNVVLHRRPRRHVLRAIPCHQMRPANSTGFIRSFRRHHAKGVRPYTTHVKIIPVKLELAKWMRRGATKSRLMTLPLVFYVNYPLPRVARIVVRPPF